MKFTDQYIIECLRAGDEKPLEYLYKQNYKMVLNFIKMNSGDEDEAKDIFQEALFTFWEKVMNGSIEMKASISTILFAICKNKWLKTLRNKRSTISIEHITIENDLYEWESPEVSVDSTVQINAVMQCLSDSTDHCRLMLEYYYWSKFSTQKISQLMELKNEDTVKTGKYKCLKKLEVCAKNRLGIN